MTSPQPRLGNEPARSPRHRSRAAALLDLAAALGTPPKAAEAQAPVSVALLAHASKAESPEEPPAAAASPELVGKAEARAAGPAACARGAALFLEARDRPRGGNDAPSDDDEESSHSDTEGSGADDDGEDFGDDQENAAPLAVEPVQAQLEEEPSFPGFHLAVPPKRPDTYEVESWGMRQPASPRQDAVSVPAPF